MSKQAQPEQESPWFSDAEVVDSDWVEIVVQKEGGESIRFRVPRRTHFDKVDQAAQAAQT